MPAIMAKLVIRIGRRRCLAPSSAACRESAPWRRAFSAKVTSKMAFAVATPMAMIAPMNDWMFIVVPVASKASDTPASTAGAADITVNARPID